MGFARSVRLACLGCAVALAVSCQSADTHAIGDTRPARACPAYLDLELDARDSRFDPGYTGAAHGIGLANGSNLTVEVYEHDADCRRVRFRGPVHPAAADPIDPQRCLGKLSQTCATDADCIQGTNNFGNCRFLFPPISSTTVGTETCSLAHFEPDAAGDPPVEGVFDLDTGEMDMERFDLGIAVFSGACTACQNDPTTFDGVAGGTCGATTTACDVVGIGQVSTSYDCPIAGTQLTTISLPGTSATTGTHVWKLDASRSTCTSGTNAGTQRCWCGMCNNGKACVTSADCPTGTACGVGSANGVTFNTANNNCGTDGPCVWNDAMQVGKCMKDATHRCYPDSPTQEIVAQGSAEVNDGFYTSQIANFTCLPAIGGDLGPIIDTVGGFPGPLLFEARFHVTARGGT